MSLTTTAVEREGRRSSDRRPARSGGKASRKPALSPLHNRQRKIFGPFVALPLAFYLVLFIGPSLYSVYASFTSWNGMTSPEWVGTQNYKRLLDDPTFQTSFKNTFLVMVVVGLVMFVLAFGLMLVLRDMRGRGFVRGVVFLPHIVSSIALAIFWGMVVRYDGLLNAVITKLGGSPVAWIGPSSAFMVIMVALVWINTGFYIAIMMAAVDRIPPYLFEDAELAGASGWQKLRNITLPMSWDVISVAAIMWAITSVKVFEFIYAFGARDGYGPPAYESTAAVFVYGQTVGGRNPLYRFGYASASAVVVLVAVMLIVFLLRRIMRRDPIEF